MSSLRSLSIWNIRLGLALQQRHDLPGVDITEVTWRAHRVAGCGSAANRPRDGALAIFLFTKLPGGGGLSEGF